MMVYGSYFGSNSGGNYRRGGGGAIDIIAKYGFAGSIQDPRVSIVNVTNSRFNSNRGGNGGAIYVDGVTFTLNASSFIDNRANWRGGAIAMYSMKGHPGSSSSITNSTFHNNRSTINGGAIHIVGGAYWTGPSAYWPTLTNPGPVNASIKNSTFVNNRSTSYYNGSAINVSLSGLSSVGPYVRLYNSVVSSSGWPRPGIGLHAKENVLSTDSSCSANVSAASDVGLGGIVAPDNAPAYSPLLSDSPAIGAGNSAQCPSTDIRGEGRPQPAASNCDLGAYEHPSDLVGCSTERSAGNANLTALGLALAHGNINSRPRRYSNA